ncbi:MAG: sulfite exporter TauE/SafE family protein [Myxococcales bacterium]|nr:MAG: sulfite exporter TauE/SafE family protein [Myxococcales bacterium]
MVISVLFFLAIAALLTSALSAVLGMGGGLTLVGVMTVLLPAKDVVPLHGAVQLISNFTRVMVFLRHVYWKIFFIYAPSLIPGITLAAYLWSGSKLDGLKPFIGLFILAFLYWRHHKRKFKQLKLWVFVPVALITGFLAIFVGAIGPFLAPFFLRDDLEKEQIIATKAICQMWTHIFKIPAFLAFGFPYQDHVPLLLTLVACVMMGTLLGKRLLSRIPQHVFIRLFEGVLGVLALYLVGDWLAALL